MASRVCKGHLQNEWVRKPFRKHPKSGKFVCIKSSLQCMHILYLFIEIPTYLQNSSYGFLWNFAQQKTFIQRIRSVKDFKRKCRTGLKFDLELKPLWPVLDWIWIILVPYFESTNSSLLRKCALWNFEGKCCLLLQLLNYFIVIGKLYLCDCRSKQILPNIYGFKAKMITNYETEKRISNKDFFIRKWILTPYLSELPQLSIISLPCCTFF